MGRSVAGERLAGLTSGPLEAAALFTSNGSFSSTVSATELVTALGEADRLREGLGRIQKTFLLSLTLLSHHVP